MQQPDCQLPLPLAHAGWSEGALRAAHRAAHVALPFELAVRDRALEICLRCLAEARQKRSLH